MVSLNGIVINTRTVSKAIKCITVGSREAWNETLQCAECPFMSMCDEIKQVAKRFILEDRKKREGANV